MYAFVIDVGRKCDNLPIVSSYKLLLLLLWYFYIHRSGVSSLSLNLCICDRVFMYTTVKLWWSLCWWVQYANVFCVHSVILWSLWIVAHFKDGFISTFITNHCRYWAIYSYRIWTTCGWFESVTITRCKEIDDQGAIDSFNKNTLNSLVIDRNVIITQLFQ